MTIREMLRDLNPDVWRDRVGFSPEVESANIEIFKRGASATDIEGVLNRWIERHQPCLFGRVAAKRGLISYCILTESDLQGSDESISEKIEAAHLSWSGDAFRGAKSAFVLLAASEKIAYAEPSLELMRLAQALCGFILRREVKPDHIYFDDLLLELNSAERQTWRWDVGVNYFCANGDKRWWQDHRIPGGLAFSMNSVGHMVRSGQLARAMKDLEEMMGLPPGGWKTNPIDSLPKALELAMRTIHNASDAVSGRATHLLATPDDRAELVVRQCPVDLPDDLADKNYCEYFGYYHTDYTVPSEYFSPDVKRPEGLRSQPPLDFTYLFHKAIDNPDFVRMGEGRRIRADGDLKPVIDRFSKRGKGDGESIELTEAELRARGLVI